MTMVNRTNSNDGNHLQTASPSSGGGGGGGAGSLSTDGVISNSNKKQELLDDDNANDKDRSPRSLVSGFSCMSSVRVMVLLILCLQNSLYTVTRRFSLAVRNEQYSKYEVLLMGEFFKIAFSAYMILQSSTPSNATSSTSTTTSTTSTTTSANITGLRQRLRYLISTSRKMVVLALLYGAMNILSLISLRNIGAGMFTIFAQCKILTTATFSTIILRRKYTWTQWRALISLSLGVLLFSQPIWDKDHSTTSSAVVSTSAANAFVGTVAVLIEVSLSGFASIYFEKVIKTDPLQLSIWERNFQLAIGSVPVYVAFMFFSGDIRTMGKGWSMLTWAVSLLGAAGGLLVALSIKYGDSILKTLATTGAILLSSVIDRVWLGGPLTPAMVIAAGQVVLAISNYTFDTSPKIVEMPSPPSKQQSEGDEELALLEKDNK